MRVVVLILVSSLATATTGAPADVVIGDYRLTVESSELDVLRLYKSGTLVKQIDEFARLDIGAPLEGGSPDLPPGADVNADGVPDLTVFGWSGGAHCCFRAWVFSLGEEFEVLAEIAGIHTEVRSLQADDDPELEFAVRDWSCEYWPYDFAGSPSVEVILDWRGRTLQPSAPLTDAALPRGIDLDDLARRYAGDPSWSGIAYDPICGIFTTAMGLIYAGEPDRAATFISAAWGGDRAEMARLTLEFGRRLAKSRYLDAIESQRSGIGHGAR